MCAATAHLTVRCMKTRWLMVVVLVLLSFTATGCMHWASVSSVDDAVGACRVRVLSDDHAPVVLERPTAERVSELVHEARHPRIQVRKINAWATALIATGGFIASAFTAFVIAGFAAIGIAGG